MNLCSQAIGTFVSRDPPLFSAVGKDVSLRRLWMETLQKIRFLSLFWPDSFPRGPEKQTPMEAKTFCFFQTFTPPVYSPQDMRLLSAELHGSSKRSNPPPKALYWRGTTNRRRHLRYPLKAAIRYHWRDAQGVLCRGRGWTRDVSEGGVLIATTNCPFKGDLVDLALRLPRDKKATTGPPLFLRMKGEVVRVLVNESGKAVCGFALQSHKRPTRKAPKAANLAVQPEHVVRRDWN